MITREFIELDDAYFVDEKKRPMEAVLLVWHCREITKKNGSKYVQRKRGTVTFSATTKRTIEKQVADFAERPDVVLLAGVPE